MKVTLGIFALLLFFTLMFMGVGFVALEVIKLITHAIHQGWQK